MAVAIRLQRIGKHKQPYYRLVATDSRRPNSGKPLEILGSYNPRAEKTTDKIVFKKERLEYWIGVGAKPSETVTSILKTLARESGDRKRKPKKSKKTKAKELAAKKAAEEAKKDDAKPEAKKEAKS